MMMINITTKWVQPLKPVKDGEKEQVLFPPSPNQLLTVDPHFRMGRRCRDVGENTERNKNKNSVYNWTAILEPVLSSAIFEPVLSSQRNAYSHQPKITQLHTCFSNILYMILALTL